MRKVKIRTQRDYIKKKRDVRYEKGLCIYCGINKHEVRLKGCRACLDTEREIRKLARGGS